MHPDFAVQLLGQMLWTGLIVVSPLMLTTLLVGLLISVLQVVTQVQEMSLTFIPKILVAVFVLIAVGPWMLRRLVTYSVSLVSGIPSMF